MPSFWKELRKRKVVRVGIAYAIVAWLLVQVAATVFPVLNLPVWSVRLVTVLLILGAPVALILAWAYELTPRGVERSPPVLTRRQILKGTAYLGIAGLGAAVGAYLHARLWPAVNPSFRRISFRRGMIRTARFATGSDSVLYGALWDGDICRTYSVHPARPESGTVDLPPAKPLAVSQHGELAIALGDHYRGVMTYGTLARVPLGGGAPRELVKDVKYADWSPDGAQMAIIRRDGNRDRLEYPIGQVLAESSPLADNTDLGGLSFPRISPDGGRVAFFDLSAVLAGRVVIVDSSGKRTNLTPEYRNVFGLAWHGDEIWFTAAEERPLLRDAVFAVSNGRPTRRVARLTGNATIHDVSPDGRILLAHTHDREGIAVHVGGTKGERDLSWLDAPELADMTPDGSMILFTESGVGGGRHASVYLRRTDGSAAVRLGDGYAIALSHDGRWAMRMPEPVSPHLHLIPTGPGDVRRLDGTGLTYISARWLPDGERAVISGRDGDRPARLYVLELDSGAVRAITPEHVGVGSDWSVSPDGTAVAVAEQKGQIRLYPVAGGPRANGPAMTTNERLVGWIGDGLLVAADRTGMKLGRIDTVDIDTGARAFWRDIQPLDPTGLMWVGRRLVVTPDGRSYAYSWHRALSDLYIVEGLH